MIWLRNRRPNGSRGRYHPSRKKGHSRINGRQKLLRQQAHKEHIQKKKKDNAVKPIDTSKSDWSDEA